MKFGVACNSKWESELVSTIQLMFEAADLVKAKFQLPSNSFDYSLHWSLIASDSIKYDWSKKYYESIHNL